MKDFPWQAPKATVSEHVSYCWRGDALYRREIIYDGVKVPFAIYWRADSSDVVDALYDAGWDPRLAEDDSALKNVSWQPIRGDHA